MFACWIFLNLFLFTIIERVEIIALMLSLVQELEHAPTIVLSPIFTCPYRLSGCIDPIGMCQYTLEASMITNFLSLVGVIFDTRLYDDTMA